MLHIEEKELTADDELLMDSFSLNYDCPGFPSVFDYSLAAVQGSLAAANALICRHCEVKLFTLFIFRAKVSIEYYNTFVVPTSY